MIRLVVNVTEPKDTCSGLHDGCAGSSSCTVATNTVCDASTVMSFFNLTSCTTFCQNRTIFLDTPCLGEYIDNGTGNYCSGGNIGCGITPCFSSYGCLNVDCKCADYIFGPYWPQ